MEELIAAKWRGVDSTPLNLEGIALAGAHEVIGAIVQRLRNVKGQAASAYADDIEAHFLGRKQP